MQEHRGTLILVLGILGIVVCQPVGIAAWVMGNSDLQAMDAGTMDPEGRGMTQAGKILGIISVVLMVIGIAIMAIVFGLGMVGAVAGGQG